MCTSDVTTELYDPTTGHGAAPGISSWRALVRVDLGDAYTCLSGELFDSTSVEGCDSVKTK